MMEKVKWLDPYHFISKDVKGKPKNQNSNSLSRREFGGIVFFGDKLIEDVARMSRRERKVWRKQVSNLVSKYQGPGGP